MAHKRLTQLLAWRRPGEVLHCYHVVDPPVGCCICSDLSYWGELQWALLVHAATWAVVVLTRACAGIGWVVFIACCTLQPWFAFIPCCMPSCKKVSSSHDALLSCCSFACQPGCGLSTPPHCMGRRSLKRSSCWQLGPPQQQTGQPR